MAFSIRMSADEKELATSYANLHSITLAEAFRQALFEKIEDEFDLAVADEAHREWEEDGKKSYSWDEFKKELDL
ncbi:type II toxin-antitoxin system RelB family antitoxin [uncultured Varibaculum sp.]|uniref:type II toxin-antitoxin system RelB family antitoxin n=1 Tax=uncultured Varibaculum sp. TaxID=413896 RepID=UPI0027D968BC|nr:DUF6290 family protein [uncultured Varibaculum sp.]